LNEKNIYITKKYIHTLLSNYGIKKKIKNLNIFQRAVTHESYLVNNININNENDNNKINKLIKMLKDKEIQPIEDIKNAIPLQEYSYERLEFLGDSIIHAVLAEYLFNRYPEKYEGFMTKLRTKIENGQQLAVLAKELGLHRYVLLSRYIEQIGGRDKNYHIFEDAFESFVGALYIDTDYDFKLCKKFIINVIEKHINFSHLIYYETNFKDILLQYYHKMKWPDPKYNVIEILEKNSKKYFKMSVTGKNNEIVGVGTGSSKQKGAQRAAQQAIQFYNIIDDESSDEEIYEEY
jgi:dsRNA-specific ribonuclease